VLTVRATRKLLDRLGPATPGAEQASTTLLGDWYGTVWFWRPQVALLVSEVTLLPVLMPLAPAGTLLERLGPEVAAVLAVHGAPAEFIDAEVREMDPVRLARTASRSVVGIMNEFAHLADAWRQDGPACSRSRCAWPLRPAAPCTGGTSAPTANSPLLSLPGLTLRAEPSSLVPSAGGWECGFSASCCLLWHRDISERRHGGYTWWSGR
jgi:hypothetical protein